MYNICHVCVFNMFKMVKYQGIKHATCIYFFKNDKRLYHDQYVL